MSQDKHNDTSDNFFKMLMGSSASIQPKVPYGNVIRVIGSLIKTNVKQVDISEQVRLINPKDGSESLGEVVGLEDDGAIISPINEPSGISPRTRIVPTGSPMMIKVGPWCIGGVFNGLGEPIQLKTPEDPLQTSYVPVVRAPPKPMDRQLIHNPIPIGIRAIDSLLTTGLGQRVGIFGSAGCGKSSLMAMIVGPRQQQPWQNILEIKD